MPNRQQVRIYEHALHTARFERMTTEELLEGLRDGWFRNPTYARQVLRDRGIEL